jgi:acyl carrier protein
VTADDRVKQVLSRIFEIPMEEIDDGTSPGTVGLWDSLNHLRLISELEKVFEMRLAQKEIRAMVSYAVIRETVSRHIGGEPAD